MNNKYRLSISEVDDAFKQMEHFAAQEVGPSNAAAICDALNKCKQENLRLRDALTRISQASMTMETREVIEEALSTQQVTKDE